MPDILATSYAPKSLNDLETLLKNDIKVKVAVDGVLRGKYMSKEKFLSAASSDGFGFCSVIFGWDIHDAVYSRELLISNRANGYRDILAVIDLSTYRRLPWENNVPFFLVSFLDPDTKEPICVCPRGTLKGVTDRAAEYGWTCYAGVEYEYFNFKETPQTVADKRFHNLEPLTSGMHGYSLLRPQLNNEYFNDLFDVSAVFEVPIEGHHTETGPGVFETALAYTSAQRMADNALLFKFLAKSMGMKHGVIPSFMAKPWGNLPGCSGHVHVSLRNSSGANIFAIAKEEVEAGGRKGAANEDTKYVSQEAEWFLAGVLEGLPDIMPMLVPTVNGYKRLVGGEAFWAPNAVTYGYDSRAASIRIISPPSVSPSATRFEVRVPGADMNPYFALSAIIALGMRGIQRKVELTGPPVSQLSPEDKKSGKVKMLPTSLESATQRMMAPGSIAREEDVFGSDFVEHYGGTREHEVKLWNEAVTNWEVERYLELV
ncbi:glutamine synthetase/guanido kinase [Punctularia strigosozonata HHB-11173 SS5]|uniref:glutamine synthetase/guanido kinase n=1 Tax=Punctularia strigosozonata (strain HHB-11173) TaxID=741275 RepID=UPI00044180F0|nr:glutamine synthetase/guanido kinase [Punctularia strigosozonata HHB-11173 SS5]EIN07163.1 glutamine synthetase/guanido kinase [Punctularia strigosozonata HHB-11173 SS5]